MCVFVCVCICVFTYMYVHICVCIFYSIFIILLLLYCVVLVLWTFHEMCKFELICGLQSALMVRFMARLTDGCDIPKSSALQSCIFPVAKYRSVAKHFISGLIGLFQLVGDVIASRTNSTTSFIPSRFSLYLFIKSRSSIVSNTFSLAAIFRFFVNRSSFALSEKNEES